jgi:hypothetical protein
MSSIEMTNGTITLAFDTIEEFEQAIPSIVGFYQPE